MKWQNLKNIMMMTVSLMLFFKSNLLSYLFDLIADPQQSQPQIFKFLVDLISPQK